MINVLTLMTEQTESLSSWNSRTRIQNGETRVRRIDGRLSSILPIRPSDEVAIALSEQIEDTLLGHVGMDDVLQ